LLHGFSGMKGGTLFFYSRVGAVPVLLNMYKNSINYSFYPVDIIDSNSTCIVFDEFDLFLDDSDKKYGMKYIKSGLNVRFDNESVAEYYASMESDEKFERMILRYQYLTDQHANMDW